MTYYEAVNQAKRDSKNGYVQHVNSVMTQVGPFSYLITGYIVSDWYDFELTVISFENGREL